jgi:hypothetical protein
VNRKVVLLVAFLEKQLVALLVVQTVEKLAANLESSWAEKLVVLKDHTKAYKKVEMTVAKWERYLA